MSTSYQNQWKIFYHNHALLHSKTDFGCNKTWLFSSWKRHQMIHLTVAQRIKKYIPVNAFEQCAKDWFFPETKSLFSLIPILLPNVKTSVLPQAAFNRSQILRHPFLQHILYQQHEYTHYFLKEYIKIPHQANERLICLFHGGFTFCYKPDSTKDRKKTFYNLFTQTSKRKLGQKKNLMVSFTFTCTVLCTVFYVLKINSTTSNHIDSTKLSQQLIFPQKGIFSIR